MSSHQSKRAIHNLLDFHVLVKDFYQENVHGLLNTLGKSLSRLLYWMGMLFFFPRKMRGGNQSLFSLSYFTVPKRENGHSNQPRFLISFSRHSLLFSMMQQNNNISLPLLLTHKDKAACVFTIATIPLRDSIYNGNSDPFSSNKGMHL